MKRKLSYLMSVLLVAGLMIPAGSLQAFADDMTTESSTPAVSADAVAPASTDAVDTTAAPAAADSTEATDATATINSTDSVTEETSTADTSSASSVTADMQATVSEDATTNSLDVATPLAVSSLAADASDALLTASLTRAGPLQRPGAGQEVSVNLTGFKFKDMDHNDTTEIRANYNFFLSMDWDASGKSIHEGDYFDIKLPDQMKFPEGNSNFDITDSNGNVIAHGEIQPGPDNNGGKVHVTFTNYVNNRYDIKGNIQVKTRFNTSRITPNENNNFTIETGGKTKTSTVKVIDPWKLVDETVGKWGEQDGSDPNTTVWYVRINHMKDNLTNVVISDHLTSDQGLDGIHYIAGSFELQHVTMDEFGHTTSVISRNDINSSVQISADGTSFTYPMGNINGDQYVLRYKTTYKPGMKLLNHIKLVSTEKTKEASSSYHYTGSNGNGEGSLFSKIKIIKVSASDQTVKLAGAVFTITSVSDPTKTYTLTTDENGEAITDRLVAGQYTIKEVTAPEGYLVNDETYTVTVTSNAATIQTVKDEQKPEVPDNPNPGPNPEPSPNPEPPTPGSSVLPLTADGFMPLAGILGFAALAGAGLAVRAWRCSR